MAFIVTKRHLEGLKLSCPISRLVEANSSKSSSSISSRSVNSLMTAARILILTTVRIRLQLIPKTVPEIVQSFSCNSMVNSLLAKWWNRLWLPNRWIMPQLRRIETIITFSHKQISITTARVDSLSHMHLWNNSRNNRSKLRISLKHYWWRVRALEGRCWGSIKAAVVASLKGGRFSSSQQSNRKSRQRLL